MNMVQQTAQEKIGKFASLVAIVVGLWFTLCEQIQIIAQRKH